MNAHRVLLAVALIASAAHPSFAQHLPADSTRPRPRRGAEIAIPMASLFVPGIGQFVHGAPVSGLAYSSVYTAGVLIGRKHEVPDSLDIPREPLDQRSDLAWTFAMSSMWLSSWDAFNRAVPAQQSAGRYAFLGKRETLGQLVAAPFDPSFLRRWTTWVDLGQTALVSAVILSDRKSNLVYPPFRGRDAGWAGTVSMNAAVAEEAFFRGYLLPMMYEKTGRFWVANTAQAALFALGHSAGAGNVFIGASGLWEGWVTRRNGWSVRESIFHHFWYDAAVITAIMLADEQGARPRRIGLANFAF